MSTPPLVSVVVPTYRRPGALDACLAALAGQDPEARPIEVVVVDDGSPEALDSVVDLHRAALEVTLLRQSNAGPAAARNAGGAVARGRYLAFTDDDCRPGPGWLAALRTILEEHPEAMVGGRTTNLLRANHYAEASQLLISHLYEHFNRDPVRGTFMAGNNLALAADAFRELGGFDTRFLNAGGEDRDLCRRWIAAGRPIVMAPGASVGHAHDLNLRSFWRQHRAYGRGARSYRQAAAADHQLVHFEDVGFYGRMLTRPWSESCSRKLVLAGLLALSQVANAVGFARP